MAELPIEICERVINIISGVEFEYGQNESENRRDLFSCLLVCRAWGALCSLYLSQKIEIVSKESLQSISTLLRRSPFAAGRATRLEIRGTDDDSDQSWVALVPMFLPKLPRLHTISFTSVNLAQQNPRITQLYTLLRWGDSFDRSRSRLIFRGVLHTPAQIPSFAAALKTSPTIIDSVIYKVNTSSDVTRSNIWPDEETRGRAGAGA